MKNLIIIMSMIMDGGCLFILKDKTTYPDLTWDNEDVPGDAVVLCTNGEYLNIETNKLALEGCLAACEDHIAHTQSQLELLDSETDTTDHAYLEEGSEELDDSDNILNSIREHTEHAAGEAAVMSQHD